MNCKVKLRQCGCADGEYTIRAKGFLVAVLSWANQEGVLPGWTPFAYIPLDPSGNGVFHFSGKRAIPPSVTHVHLRCIASDFTRTEEMLVEIPKMYRMAECSDHKYYDETRDKRACLYPL